MYGFKKAPAESVVKVCIRVCFGGMLCTLSSVICFHSDSCFLLFKGSSTHQRPALVTVFRMDMLQVELLFLQKPGICQNCPYVYCSLNENTIISFSYFSFTLSSDITTESSCWF
jgi:hypothetical protein